MNLVIYTEAQDKTASAVVSMTDTTPLTQLEQLVLGDTPTISVTFTDGSAAPAWAGQAGYTMSLALGTPDGDGRLDYTQIQAETAITGGWEGNLPLDTPALVTALNLLVNQGATILRPPTQRYTYQAPRFAWFVLQIAVRGPDGYLTTYASLRVCVLNRVITSNFTEQQSPDAEVFAWTEAQLALKANIASPTFTGIPVAPTAAADTDTTQIATTAFVLGQASDATPLINGTAAAGTSEKYARGNHVHPTDTSRAPLASPTFTGTPAAPTAAVDTSTTQLATTAYVTGQGYLKSATAATTYQPLDAELTAISGIATNGIVTRTSSSTAAARTITGTAGQVTVTNGDGVSGNPTLSLPTALTSINSVTASGATDLTLSGGSSGASLALGQGTAGALAATSASTTADLLTIKNTAAAGYSSLLFQNSAASGQFALGYGNASAAAPFTNSAYFYLFGNDLKFFKLGVTEIARLTNTGNLLIGGTTDITGAGGLKVFGTTAATSTTSGAFQLGNNVGLSGNSGGPSYFGGTVNSTATGRNLFAGALASTGSNPTALASSTILDQATGTARLISYGADTLTPGAFTLFGLSSDGTAGAARFQISALGQAALASTSFLNTASWRTGSIAIGPDGTDKVVIGPLISTTNGPTIGGHATGLGGWAPINVNGSTVTLRIGETAALSINASSNVSIPVGDLTVTNSIGITSGNITESVTNGTATWYANYNGYQQSNTQFRNFGIYDGKRAEIAMFTGSTKAATFAGVVSTTNTTAATNTTSGALQVAGGVGVAGAGYFGGNGAFGPSFTPNAWGTGGQLDVNGTTGGILGVAYAGAAKGYVLAEAGGILVNSHAGGTAKFNTSGSGATTIGNSAGVTVAGPVITSSATLSGAGAIPITTSLVKFTSTASANALTLANGVDGQRLTVVHDVKGTLGTGVITPTTKTGFSTITLTNAGDSVSLVYVTTRGWMVTGSYLATIAP